MRKVPLLLCVLWFGGALRLTAAPGDLDATFNPNAGDEVDSFVFQPDGRLVIGGFFETMSGATRRNAARLLPGGTLDTGFDPAGNDSVQCIVVQQDGWIVTGGLFTSMRQSYAGRLARLHADGTRDESYSPAAKDDIRCLAIDSEGRILAGGLFTLIAGEPRSHLARITTGGQIDASFNLPVNGLVRTIVVQPDGGLLLGGAFSSVGGVVRNRIARLRADGTLDTAFNPGIAGAAVYAMTLQADGKTLAGGSFGLVGGTARTNLVRLNPNGTVDPTFSPTASDIVRCVAMQADGDIICSGNFTQVNGITRNRLARLRQDGTLDTAFNPNANDFVTGVTLQADGRVIAGGYFTRMSGTARNRICRLENGLATQTLSVDGSRRVQWRRGGTSPETQEVVFDLFQPLSGWTRLGRGTRIPGGWELTGLSLPSSGEVRARARVTGAYANGSSGLVETVIPFAFSPLQVWREQHFQDMIETEDSANHADPDRDGVSNLCEFLFYLDPKTPDAAAVPRWEREGNSLVFRFMHPGAAASSVRCTGEQSDSLEAGSWSPIPNAGSPPYYIFAVPLEASGRRYLRMRPVAE